MCHNIVYHRVIAVVMVMILGAVSAATVTYAAGGANGEALHKAHCQDCHASRFKDASSIYTRPERQVKSVDQLRARVEFCSQQVNAQWFDDEVNAVTTWLNHQFYKF
ncbi:MAG: cytochrome c [Magnetococcales bacterium]|nr:cytochrome c [Magnetococcales bacterium]